MADHFWWYVARSGGLVAWTLIVASSVSGLLLATRTLSGHVTSAWMLALHRYLSALALVFTAVHVGAIVADSFVHFGIADVLVPMAASWHPLAVAWGIVGMYLLVTIEVTSLLRRHLPMRGVAGHPPAELRALRGGHGPSPDCRHGQRRPVARRDRDRRRCRRRLRRRAAAHLAFGTAHTPPTCVNRRRRAPVADASSRNCRRYPDVVSQSFDRPRFERDDALRRLRSTDFDLLVVGGGITGAGVALDAASRGLRTALVERHDFASGTSSRSSKLVHGGLRYLDQREFRLVYEGLAERQRVLENAPHLVRVLPFIVPVLTSGGRVDRRLAPVLGSALWMYDLTGGLRIGKFHHKITVDEALDRFPTFDRDRLKSVYVYYDAACRRRGDSP